MSVASPRAAKRERLIDEDGHAEATGDADLERNSISGPDGTVLEGSGERNEDVEVAKQRRGRKVDEDSF